MDTVSNYWYEHHLTCSTMDSNYVHTLISGKQIEFNFPVRRLIASNGFRLSNQSGKADIISIKQEFQTGRLYQLKFLFLNLIHHSLTFHKPMQIPVPNNLILPLADRLENERNTPAIKDTNFIS